MATHSTILAWENPMKRGASWATVYGIEKSWTHHRDQTMTTTGWKNQEKGTFSPSLMQLCTKAHAVYQSLLAPFQAPFIKGYSLPPAVNSSPGLEG